MAGLKHGIIIDERNQTYLFKSPNYYGSKRDYTFNYILTKFEECVEDYGYDAIAPGNLVKWQN